MKKNDRRREALGRLSALVDLGADGTVRVQQADIKAVASLVQSLDGALAMEIRHQVASVYETTRGTIRAGRMIRQARKMLRRCRDQFRFYEDQHMAKGTLEAEGKAEINRGLAAECQELLDMMRGKKPAKGGADV